MVCFYHETIVHEIMKESTLEEKQRSGREGGSEWTEEKLLSLH